MSQSSDRCSPLSRAEAEQVLRYWLAAVQHEEALMSRPKARAPSRGPSVPRLDLPGSGQDYFKLALDGAAQLFEAKAPVRKPFDAELSAFFESWLFGQYRRGDQDRAVSHLLTFPVVHLPRGELAGLLRCPLELGFGEPGGTGFSVPTRSQRRQHDYPNAPCEVRVALGEQPEQRLPFFLDTRLLQHQLGVVRERIDETFEQLRADPSLDARRMLNVVCCLLESELQQRSAQPESERGSVDAAKQRLPVAAIITRIHAACAGLLALQGGRARAYPVALVLDATRSKATYYLQRDIAGLLDEDDAPQWGLDSCLGAYLRGDAPAQGVALQHGLFPGPALSTSQRNAAESCAGSRFTAVQGPPGTGKTTLIVHLAAAALVKQVQALLTTGEMGDALMLVTSTNNRAVDNVVEGLAVDTDQALPLALRVGSQQVCEHVLLPVLERVRNQLEDARRVPPAVRAEALRSALRQFEALQEQLTRVLEPRQRACETLSERARLQAQLTRVQGELAASRPGSLRVAPAGRLRELLERAQPRLSHLASLTEAKPTLPALQAVDRAHRRLAKALIPQLKQALAEAGRGELLSLPPQLPPSSDPALLMGAWNEAAEAALDVVSEIQAELEAHVALEIRRERARTLEQKLGQLPADVSELPSYDTAHDELQRALFQAAVQVRQAWALAESESLLGAVSQAVAAVRGERSLRRLWKDGVPAWRRLRQLFGVWGCTLLSLGNCVPSASDAIELLVIDEAGQCHPAYAVSGLMRAKRAMVIGDVHQLEPVIEIEPDDDERVIQASGLTLSRAALAPYRVHSEARSSVQSLADRAVAVRPSLTEHFRCQPEIIRICDALCDYQLRILTPTEGPTVPLPFLERPVSLLDVAGTQERIGGSWHNRAELEHTIDLLRTLVEHGVAPSDIAVITPYRGQLEQLRKRSVQAGFPIDRSYELLDLEDALPGDVQGIALGTVHRFQGGERSIVLFSSVVTRTASLGFVDGRANLLNVAISRARHRFIALGHAGLLAQGRRTCLLTAAASTLHPDAYRSQLGLGL